MPFSCLAAARHAKLADDLGDVELGAVEADAETAGNLFVQEAFADEAKDFELARGEDVGVGRAASCHRCARSPVRAASSIAASSIRSRGPNYTTRHFAPRIPFPASGAARGRRYVLLTQTAPESASMRFE